MKLRISHLLVTLALGITGCAVQGPNDPIERDIACHSQADAWCSAVGFDTSGCHSWYVSQCEPSGPMGTVDAVDQSACLRAISDMEIGPLGWDEPESCKDTWTSTK